MRWLLNFIKFFIHTVLHCHFHNFTMPRLLWSLMLILAAITASSTSNVHPNDLSFRETFQIHGEVDERMMLRLIKFTANRFKNCYRKTFAKLDFNNKETYFKICEQVLQFEECKNTVRLGWTKLQNKFFQEFVHLLYKNSILNQEQYSSEWARINAAYCQLVVGQFKSSSKKFGFIEKWGGKSEDKEQSSQHVKLKTKLLRRNFLLHSYTASVDAYVKTNTFSFGFIKDSSEEAVNWDVFITTLCTNFEVDFNDFASMSNYIVMICEETAAAGNGVENCADLEVTDQNCYPEETLKVQKGMLFSLNLLEHHLRPLIDWEGVSPIGKVLTTDTDGSTHGALHLFRLIKALKANYKHETASARKDHSLDVRFFEEKQGLPAMISARFHQLMRFVLLKLYFSFNPSHYFDRNSPIEVITEPPSQLLPELDDVEENFEPQEDTVDEPENDDLPTTDISTPKGIVKRKKTLLCVGSILAVALASYYKHYQLKSLKAASTTPSKTDDLLMNNKQFYMMITAKCLIIVVLVIAMFYLFRSFCPCWKKAHTKNEKTAQKKQRAKKSTETYSMTSLLKPSPPTSQIKRNEKFHLKRKYVKRK